jgi:hypothetical protein
LESGHCEQIFGIGDAGANFGDMCTNQEDDSPDWTMEHFDTKTGEALDPRLVAEARSEELEYMKAIGLYVKCSLEECWKMTGKPPTSTKWVDVNKGTKDRPDVRCRLVARDFRVKGEGHRDDLFASMPPLEAKRLLFIEAAATWSSSDPTKIMLIDVKKAHLNGRVGEDVWACIELPEEDQEPGMCGRLARWLYGMRPAAKAWEEDYSEKLRGAGFVQGVAAPTVFHHPRWGVKIVVHGDDFTITGKQKYLNMFRDMMGQWYLMTVKGTLGPGAHDSKELVILNRRLRVDANFLIYEPDAKHARILCEELGLVEGSKGADSPTVKLDTKKVEEDELLGKGEATRFRALAARASYLSLDRPDIQYSSKEVCREMSAPKKSSWSRLKRLARYLLDHPRAEWRFPIRDQFDSSSVRAFSDSDWAGCRASRKSTSGGLLVVGGCCVKAWSSTQATVATSSGEAELYSLVKTASEALGFQALASDLGISMELELYVDSTAAQSIASRAGLAKTKHVEVKYLWVQQATRRGLFKVRRVPGEDNPADIMTKPHCARHMAQMLGHVGFSIRGKDAKCLVGACLGAWRLKGTSSRHAIVEFEDEPIAELCTAPARWADLVESEDHDRDVAWLDFKPPDPGGNAGGGGVLRDSHMHPTMFNQPL